MKLKKRYYIFIAFLGLVLLGSLGYYSTFKEYKGRKVFRTGQQQVDRTTLHGARQFIKGVLSVNGDYLYIKGFHANLRQAPHLEAHIITNLKHNTYCQILDQSHAKTSVEPLGLDYWYQVQVGDTIGWVFGKLVQLETDNYPRP